MKNRDLKLAESIIEENEELIERRWKEYFKTNDMITIKSISFDKNNLIVEMSDGKIVESPVNQYPNLAKGTEAQMKNYEIKGKGRWVHWEELDEDLSAEGFLQTQVDENEKFQVNKAV